MCGGGGGRLEERGDAAGNNDERESRWPRGIRRGLKPIDTAGEAEGWPRGWAKRIASSGRLPKRRELARRGSWEGEKGRRRCSRGWWWWSWRWSVVEVARTLRLRRRRFSPIKAAVERGSRSFHSSKEDTWTATTWICARPTSTGLPRKLHAGSNQVLTSFSGANELWGILYRQPWTREPSTWSPRVRNGELLCDSPFQNGRKPSGDVCFWK